MLEEKVYVLEDGTEMILLEKLIFEDTRYLLLGERKKNNILVACEKNEKLFFIDELSDDYKKIFSMLYKKYNSNK